MNPESSTNKTSTKIFRRGKITFMDDGGLGYCTMIDQHARGMPRSGRVTITDNLGLVVTAEWTGSVT
jgi:hypothetical protein